MKKYSHVFVLLSFFIMLSCASIPIPAGSPSLFTNPDQLPHVILKFSPLRAERLVLENGIILHFLEDHEVPLVNISAVIGIGSVYDPPEKEGLAELTGEVMKTGGTIFLSGNAVDETLEFFAAALNVSINREHGTVDLSVLKKDVDSGLKILSDILRYPAFEEEKLKLSKALKTESLRRLADDPQKLAFREFNRLMYRNNPRGRLPNISSVERIQRDDLVNFHRRFFYPGNILMTVTGDITKEEAINKINQYLGTWKASGGKKEIIPAPEKQAACIYFLPKDIPQSIIIHGNLAPAKNDIDAYAFEVLDFIVGNGGFRSRIFQEVRSNRGLAYSAGSFYKGRTDYGIFGAYAITGSQSTATVLSLIRSIIGDVRGKPVGELELDWAKKAINNSFIFSFLSARQIAGQQMMNEYEKLPDDYLMTYRDSITKVSAVDVKNVAIRHLAFDNAVVLVLGNEKIYQSLKSSFGDIHKLEAPSD
jgi:zinc protease